MSYAFKINQEASLAPNFSEVDVRDNTFDLPQNTFSFDREDVIHITYRENGFKKGFYAVCTGTGQQAGFTFDQTYYCTGRCTWCYSLSYRCVHKDFNNRFQCICKQSCVLK